MLLDIPQCTGRPPAQRIIQPKMSIVLRLKHPPYKILPEQSPCWFSELGKNMVKGEHGLLSLIIHSLTTVYRVPTMCQRFL